MAKILVVDDDVGVAAFVQQAPGVPRQRALPWRNGGPGPPNVSATTPSRWAKRLAGRRRRPERTCAGSG
jgi:hypothetical protein